MRKLGLMGINRRNHAYVQAYNPRHLYPQADDKLLTKKKALQEGIAVPELYAVIATQRDARHLPETVNRYGDFVIKPASGSGGNGILVISRIGDSLRRPDGRILPMNDIAHHVSNILSGQYSLGGHPDRAMIEYRVRFASLFDHVAYQGVPDIRIIVFKGYPVMSMVRLPTRHSDGKANLHQGAIGVGIDLATGTTIRGVWGNRIIEEHPDTQASIAGIEIPGWTQMLEIASRCYDLFGLGYLGVDLVIDRDRGPLMLELNVRPGLQVQVANRAGLLPRLRAVEALKEPATDVQARLAFVRSRFAAPLVARPDQTVVSQ